MFAKQFQHPEVEELVPPMAVYAKVAAGLKSGTLFDDWDLPEYENCQFIKYDTEGCKKHSELYAKQLLRTGLNQYNKLEEGQSAFPFANIVTVTSASSDDIHGDTIIELMYKTKDGVKESQN
ncbi:WSSV328 [White spot syndrome virus]|uniref:WSSV328 n=1 Tax=White spot syndrome virus TaxID=342409 RepID=A0A2I6SC38_9VIRU|nr:WSSV328 [White spot syndrome virus]